MFSAKFSFIAAALALATSVHAHGKISSPTPRKVRSSCQCQKATANNFERAAAGSPVRRNVR